MSTVKRQSFLRGVVEGFYGRPWTTEQRLDLFSRLGRWGMNCYLYAPKDDDKHRAVWRELYTLEEADHLSMLIQEARHRGIQLIYAIAPGLDITFSSEKEMEILKRKLSQIEALGCQSFALLFDDIDPDLSATDAKVFSSSAHAQAAVANDVYAHLKSPESFLFCPTEYCGSRAVPNVTNSQYLEVLGETLHQNIDILWTGPKVISKSISVTSIQELTKVLRRPPILWDNLHANDYDQRCLFLGPYQGRSTSLIPMLNGVLTNPNCEYTANFIPIHTLAQWCRSQVVKQQRHSSATVATVQLEKENTDEEEMSTAEASSAADSKMDVLLYNDKEALEIALKEWIVEFSANRRKVEDYLPPKTSKSVAVAVEADAGLTRMEGTQMEEDRNDPGKVRSGSGSSAASEMDTTPICLEESEPLSLELTSPTKSSHSAQEPFMLDDLRIMVDFFYLPHQNGERALKLLQEFCWLKKSAPGYDLLRSYRSSDSSGSDLEEASNKPTKGARAVKLKLSRESDGEEVEDVPRSGEQTEEAKVTEWLERAADLHAACEEISQCFNRLTAIPNRPLLYDLYSYMSDARETAMQLDSYVSWLEAGGMEVDPKNQPLAPHGGIVAQMLRLLPQVENPEWMMIQGQAPPVPTPHTYVIRPYREEDKELLYRTCLETGSSGDDATASFNNYPDLLGDRFVGCYLHLSSDLSFVLEDEEGQCGYVLAALDSTKFYQRFRDEWLPTILDKYPLIAKADKTSLTEEEEMVVEVNNPKLFLPDSLQRKYPSHLHIDIMKRAQGRGNGPRMIKTILSVLKAKGSHGVHLEVSANNRRALRFYRRMGFQTLEYNSQANPELSPDVVIMGRSL